ncbi:hypothetical protein EDD18DRAFT_1290852 [Armillaria luteobubalina]|uniref:F-box domain-containing protein n=1 Tax=Armillaria luteobubalina TaxID=153913 RepID=A0AA39PWC5_9AGAR|nr:hypothetical protein EDD18DRAFT_1290852 [Armillaria luteobubalina]
MSPSCAGCGHNEQDHLHLSFEAAELSASRMDELLKSNVPPLPVEHVQLEGAISKGLGYLARLQERIGQARASLEMLLDEERHVNRTMESYRTILHPIRRVPEDILREIFLSFNVETEKQGKDSLDRSFAPLIISQVCREWRSIALSTSRLWSSFRLDFDLYHNELPCQYLLQTYFLRSATHDITLAIDSTREISDSHLMPVILLSAPRWISLSVIIPHDSLHAFSAARGSLHRLHRLYVEFIDEDFPELPDGLEKPVFDAFEYAPLLRSVRTEGVPEITKQINLPWSQITDYVGQDGTTCYIDVLRLALALERISLECYEGDDVDEIVPASSHQRLRDLRVHESGAIPDPDTAPGGGIIYFLSHVEFPALEFLKMVYDHPYIRVPTSLRGSTARNLQALSISASFPISVEVQADLVDLLKTTASLSRFSLICRSALDQNDGVFLALNVNANPGIVPRLNSLTFRFMNTQPHMSPAFVDMVQSRRQAASTRSVLEELILLVRDVIPPVDLEVAARWKDLCDEGFVKYPMLQ